ncbi:MAG: PHP domain-containing protein [Oscillospiraceae bacterium]|jgi:predicted metal-dependent phosphoesterase TrpH|nr:PHP domain-containing protein [Oscillospiraceae bacterium]
MKADLHLHTRLSNGSTGIDELIFLAKNRKLSTISVTDYDTFAGSIRAQIFGKRYGIEVISGVEITAFDYQRNKEAHLLCYSCKHPNRLEGLFKKISDIRKKCACIMMQKVVRIYPILPEMVLKKAQGSKNIFKVHIMHALVDAGYTNDFFGDLYKKLFSPNFGLALCKSSEYPDVRDVLKQIKGAGGVSVLAHPGIYEDYDLIEELQQIELDGVEVWHPKNKPNAEKKLEQIADEYDLLKVGGTDFRGMYTEEANPIGTCITPQKQLEVMKVRFSEKNLV